MTLIPALFTSPFANHDPTKFGPSKWNDLVALVERVLDDDADADGTIPVRDRASVTGLTWTAPPSVDLSGYVLTSDARLSDARVPLAHTQPFSTITGTPTSLAGYGILDAVVLTGDARLSDARVPLAHTQAFSTITATPTSLAGYGILDAIVLGTRTVNGHALSADVTVTAADLGLSAVENTALSTWAGSANLVTLGTLSTITTAGQLTLAKASGFTVIAIRDASSGPELHFERSEGTLAARTAVTGTGVLAGAIVGSVWDGSAYQQPSYLTFNTDGGQSAGSHPGDIQLWTTPTGSNTPLHRVRIAQSGNVGIGAAFVATAPTAVLHLKAGTSAASSAPLKFNSGPLLTAPEAGAIEFLTDAFYATITTGAARKTLAFLESPTFTGTVTLPGLAGLVVGTTAAAPGGVEGYFVSTSASDPRGLMSAQYTTDAIGARLQLRKGRGTEAVPTTVVTGDVLGRIRFSGYDSANYLQMASIDAVSTGTIAATRVPTYLAFSVATNATPSVLTEALRLTATAITSTLGISVDGTISSNNGNVTATNGGCTVAGAGIYAFSTRAGWKSPADGVMTLNNAGLTIGSEFKADALPTVASGFGTSPSVTAGSTPLAGSVNVGTGGSATSGVITFGGTAFPSAPFVVCMNTTTGAVVRATATTTQLTITAPVAFVASDVICWHCISSK